VNVLSTLVIVGGVAAITWVNWYFFFTRAPAKPNTH
jgi:hypothetical protein